MNKIAKLLIFPIGSISGLFMATGGALISCAPGPVASKNSKIMFIGSVLAISSCVIKNPVHATCCLGLSWVIASRAN